MLDWQMELSALVAKYGVAMACDLPYMSESELFGLYLFLMRLSGG